MVKFVVVADDCALKWPEKVLFVGHHDKNPDCISYWHTRKEGTITACHMPQPLQPEAGCRLNLIRQQAVFRASHNISAAHHTFIFLFWGHSLLS